MSDHSILAELEAKAREAEETAAKYRAAIAVLRGETAVKKVLAKSGHLTVREFSARNATSGRKSGPTSTMSMIRSVLHGSMKPLDIQTLVERMLLEGWDTQSENPSNTVRTALMRLAEKGDVTRNVDGSYSLSVTAHLSSALGVEQSDEDAAD